MYKTSKSIVLLVDDRPVNILALEKLLEKSDRQFLKASSGEEALKFALNRNIDLIILDVQMPTMDGFEVARILRSNKRTSDIPIIFASAEKKEHQSIIKGFEEGAVDYLSKPLDPEITKAKVAVLLKLQAQKKELVEKNDSLERAALLINNSADIIGIIDSSTLKFEEVNQAFTTILGYASGEIIGTSLEFLLSDDDRVYVRNLHLTGKDRLTFDTRVYCKNRSIKWLQWNVVSKAGKWFINARDITLEKQVEKIRDSLATIVKQSSDAIYIHDRNGQVISWNIGAEEIYGYKEAEVLKMKIWNIIPEYLHEETQLMIEQIASGQIIQSIETKRITKLGKVIDVLFSASLLVDPENKEKSIAITERDITQQKIADEQILQLNADLKKNVQQLEGANKELESFSYSVSHDLRAPLRAINGYTEILKEEYAEHLDDEGKNITSVIQKNATKMSQLIDDLLEFSRFGKKGISKSLINMTEMVHELVDEIRKTMACRAEFKILNLPPAYADRALMNQVWTNLISNSIKYSGKKSAPYIEIGSEAKDDEIMYFIKDNGAGFDMNYLDKLFGVFQRLHKSQDFEGTGIGLAIVNRIISKHGGKVWAEGAVDQGATFYFTVPLHVPVLS